MEGRPLATLCKGDFFGESALCFSTCRSGADAATRRSADCRALTDVELVELDASTVAPVVFSMPDMLENMRSVMEESPAAGSSAGGNAVRQLGKVSC